MKLTSRESNGSFLLKMMIHWNDAQYALVTKEVHIFFCLLLHFLLDLCLRRPTALRRPQRQLKLQQLSCHYPTPIATMKLSFLIGVVCGCAALPTCVVAVPPEQRYLKGSAATGDLVSSYLYLVLYWSVLSSLAFLFSHCSCCCCC